MPWLIALGILTALAILPLGASVVYDEDGAVVRIIAGPVKLQVFPGKKKAKLPTGKEQTQKKPKKAKAEKPAKPRKKAPKTSAAQQEKKGGSILDFWPFVELGLNFLGDFRRKLRINQLTLILTMAGDDPCDLAVNYGRANAAMATLLAQLERLFVIKHRTVAVNCDFTADETIILARLDLTITLGRIVALLVGYGIRAGITYFNIQNKRKGGAEL